MKPTDRLVALWIAAIGVACAAALPSPLCWAAGAGVGGLCLLWLALRGNWGGGMVACLKGLVWNRQTFCQHFLITGATGSGKTLSGLLPLLLQVFRNEPRFGALCVDVKGVLHSAIAAMAAHFRRGQDVVVLEVRPTNAVPPWLPTHRFNLVGDRTIPFTTYARCVVDTAVAMGNRHEQSFFRRAAQVHIGKALEALDAIEIEVSLENAHNLLVNPADTQAAVRKLNGTPLGEHFSNYLAQPAEQLAGIVGTVANYLHYFTLPDIARVFCRDSTFSLDDLDRGKIVCLALPQKYQTERRFVGTFLKLLFYTHALGRFDAPPAERARHNLLLLLMDECQQFVTISEDGLSDHAVVDMVREAGVAILAATQSTTSLVPILGAEQAKVFALNLRNRLIFTAADEEDARASAEFLGRIVRRERSVTRGQGRHTVTFRETEDYRIKPHQLRALRKHQCILVHCEHGYRKATIAPIQPDGTVPAWYRKQTLF